MGSFNYQPFPSIWQILLCRANTCYDSVMTQLWLMYVSQLSLWLIFDFGNRKTPPSNQQPQNATSWKFTYWQIQTIRDNCLRPDRDNSNMWLQWGYNPKTLILKVRYSPNTHSRMYLSYRLVKFCFILYVVFIVRQYIDNSWPAAYQQSWHWLSRGLQCSHYHQPRLPEESCFSWCSE